MNPDLIALLTTAVEAHDFMAPLSAAACVVLLADAIAWRYWPGQGVSA